MVVDGKYGKSLVGAIVALALVGSLTGARAGDGTTSPAVHEHSVSKLTKLAFQDDMRKLWEDHITWTRLVIVGLVEDLPDLGPTVDRLLQNQVDIGDAVRPFYGDAAANRLTELLTGHITTAAELLTAAKAGDDATFDDALDAWYRNGRQIARFLHEANPDNWGLREMRLMMREHLDLTLAEAVHRFAGEYEQEIAVYDEVHVQILHMADMLSGGIIRQFPGKFA